MKGGNKEGEKGERRGKRGERKGRKRREIGGKRGKREGKEKEKRRKEGESIFILIHVSNRKVDFRNFGGNNTSVVTH